MEGAIVIFRYMQRWLMPLAIMFIQGCSEPPMHPFTFAANNWPGYYPIFLAEDLGYIDPAKLNVTQQASTSEVLRLLRAGTVDIGALTLDEALLLLQDKPDIKVILVADFSAGGDAILAQEEITSLEQLQGKRIGVEKTALGAFVLDRALGMAGVEVEDVYAISLEVSEHKDAFLKKRVDAVVTFEPVLSQLLARGANRVFDSKQIPGEIVDVIVATDRAIEARPERLAHFVDAWFKALDYMNDKPEEAYERLSPEGLSFEEYLRAQDGIHLPDKSENEELFADDAYRLEAVRQKMIPVMLDSNLLEMDVGGVALFDGRFVTGRGE